MNIKITYNWLLEYLDTDADPYELQKYLSLCGPSIERVEKINDDYSLDIEVTSNRIDSASVFGIAQEASAILPQFGKKAKLKFNPLEKYTFDSLKDLSSNSTTPGVSSHTELTADIKLLDPKLASRVTAIVLSNIEIGKSPELISKRLTMCDIKSINNVVDVSNYLMLSLGQPNHTFDYDKIIDHKLHIRESKKGETVKTLDEKEITLPGGDIVIEDGSGHLTDLAGIMGGYDSMISDSTKNVLLLLETYDPKKIRKTSMTTGQRTIAATYFEKGLDPERIESTLVYGVELLKEHASASVASDVIDLYPQPVIPKRISVSVQKINALIGEPVPVKKMKEILENIGFETMINSTSSGGLQAETLNVLIPSYRIRDVETWQDIAEEIARIYGYFNIAGKLQSTRATSADQTLQKTFAVERKAKYYLKHAGLHEVYNYSMISKQTIDKTNYEEKEFLKLKNTISENIEYLKTHLLPSLVENIEQNEGKRPNASFFEIAKTYKKTDGELPIEKRHLAIATRKSYSYLKGVLEGLFAELNIPHVAFEAEKESRLFNKNVVAKIKCGDLYNGHIGLIAGQSNMYGVELDFDRLVLEANSIPAYAPISTYATIRLDVTYTSSPKHIFQDIKSAAFKTSKLLQKVLLIDRYEDKITIRFVFSSNKDNITEEIAKEELNTIKKVAGI